jgi:hypothetical protein
MIDVGKNYPREFLQAIDRYTDAKFVFRSEIWQELQRWRQYAKRNPETTPWFKMTNTHPSCDDRVFIADFKELILAAVFRKEEDILRALVDTVRLAQAPEPDMHGVRAAMIAFRDLCKGGVDENNWPLKKEVRERAIEILKENGSLVPGRREWPRIFKKAGLSKLRNATRRSNNRVT